MIKAGIYLLSSVCVFASLGFEGEYKYNKDLYVEMINENIKAEYISQNMRVKIEIVDSLNVFVKEKRKPLSGDKQEKNESLKDLVELKGSAAQDTYLEFIYEDRIVARCDNYKWK
ncbi:MAG: hypothetical protein RRZ91_09290 [Cetobacterium sp.]|uniref:hypothetical protein n=1 Tax=Cetobacterium sp. TaxID=2071632 RepID=UPI002FC732BB